MTGLFVAIGHDPRNELVKGVVDLDDEGYVLVEGRTTPAPTSPGVFACGDLVDHTYRQAITAAGLRAAPPPSTPSATWPTRAGDHVETIAERRPCHRPARPGEHADQATPTAARRVLTPSPCSPGRIR